MSGRPDVIVIGAGVVGAMCAMRLAEAGLTVTVLEQDFPGSGSTGAAMGHIVVMDDSPAQLALAARSRDRWRELIPTLPVDPAYEQCGTLWLAADDHEMQAAHDRVRGYVEAGVEAEVIDSTRLAALEPSLRPGLAGALLVPGDGVCYPPAAARGLMLRACAAGAVFRHGTVAEVSAGRVVLADGTALHAGAIVIAAGTGSTGLIPGLPIVPRKGHLVITNRRPGMVRHQLVELGYLASAHGMGAASVAFNVQPRPGGQLLVGSSRELVGFDRTINRELCGRMLDRAISMLPELATASVWRTWTGFRPATPDSLPLIGRWLPIDGVWIAAGHEGLGITMAPGTADLVAASIMGTDLPLDITPYDPCRPMSVHEAFA